jgi:hypothetical protein
MKLTDYLAIWDAALSTLLAGWSIYKDFLKRHRVKVEAGFRKFISGDGIPGTDVFAVTVTNLSDKTIKVTHCALFPNRRYRPPWIDRPSYKLFTRNTQAYLFSFNLFTAILFRALCSLSAIQCSSILPATTSPPFPR